MTTISQLYNNIKTFVLQTFESKEEEDINLPIEVEQLFKYVNGKVSIAFDNTMELKITGNSFSTYSSTPFTYNGKVFVDWGDDTDLIEYTGGKLTHTYSSSDDYIVKIYGDITSLEGGCFNSCTGLTSIVIPNTVTSLGKTCFYHCTSLNSIIIPNTVTSLGDGCFNSCTSLTSIAIPNGVTSLGEGCFDSCTGLTSIVIPNTVTSLGRYCFLRCTGLTSIKLNWDTSTNILTYNSSWISNANSYLYIPNGTTSLYTDKEYPSNRILEVGD